MKTNFKQLYWSLLFLIVVGSALHSNVLHAAASSKEHKTYGQLNKKINVSYDKTTGIATLNGFTFKVGDLVFHRSTSTQAKVIAFLQKNEMTHVGMIIMDDDKMRVIEAVEPVRIVDIENFFLRGRSDQPIAVARFERLLWGLGQLNELEQQQVSLEAKKYLKRHYDTTFSTGDQKIYCSELIYLAYKNAGLIAEKKHENGVYYQQVKFLPGWNSAYYETLKKLSDLLGVELISEGEKTAISTLIGLMKQRKLTKENFELQWLVTPANLINTSNGRSSFKHQREFRF